MDFTSGGEAAREGELLVFVYGTLLRGEADHGLLNGARFLRSTRTCADFELHDLGDVPGMVKGGSTPVRGELYRLDSREVRRLDELEDHPETFRRSRVRLEDGSEAFSYLLPRAQGRPFPRIPSGCWKRRTGGVRRRR